MNKNNKKEICKNCKYFLDSIGIGRGIRCINPNNSKYIQLTSLNDSCKLFEIKTEIKNNIE